MIRQIWISGLTTGSLVRRLCQLGGDAHVEREQDGARLARMDAAFLAADGGTRRRAGHLCRHRRTELRHVLGRHLLRRHQPPDGGDSGGRDGLKVAVRDSRIRRGYPSIRRSARKWGCDYIYK